MKIVLSSRNKHKISELRAMLEREGVCVDVLSLDDIGFFDEIDESGTTFEENALIKASVPAKLGYIGIADDSGLCVDALGSAPGVYSARYAGEGANDQKNNEKLLYELSDVPPEKRGAKFVCTLAAVMPCGDNLIVRGECKGRMIDSPRGQDGFGYDPLFLYEPSGKTFAELTPNEKNIVSHRAVAMKKFAADFKIFLEKHNDK